MDALCKNFLFFIHAQSSGSTTISQLRLRHIGIVDKKVDQASVCQKKLFIPSICGGVGLVLRARATYALLLQHRCGD
jgi:hypothetical protein